MILANQKTKFSRDRIRLQKTYSQQMGITQMDFITSNVKDEDMNEEELFEM
jgi:hypothetical protein